MMGCLRKAAVATVLVPALASGDAGPLRLFAGDWDVKVTTTRPEPAVVTYKESYQLVLGGHFLQGATSDKSNGGEDLIIGAWDKNGRGYSFWIFSSTGDFLYLPPGEWNERKRRFRWKSPPNSEVYYTTVVEFPDDQTRRWTVTIKDWKGSVMLEQRGEAVRRDD